MSDIDFLRLKILTERDLGRPIDGDEIRILKALLYFGRGVKLKAQLNSEPERIGPIAERALADIAQRRKVVLQRGVLQKYKRRRKSRVQIKEIQ